jgi:hypothetical protein
MMKLSCVSKLDGIRSWSLTALLDCPGAHRDDGSIALPCQGCYARGGLYQMGAVRAIREHNREDWQREGWVADMVSALDKERYFRWFDSGDVYALELAEKMLEVMQQTPWCRHWLPTRMMKFAKFAAVFAQMQALPNVMVRFSSDSITGEFTPGLHGSTIVSDESQVQEGVFLCRAYENDGKCSGCRACYSQEVPMVAYKTHGNRMRKVVRLQAA